MGEVRADAPIWASSVRDRYCHGVSRKSVRGGSIGGVAVRPLSRVCGHYSGGLEPPCAGRLALEACGGIWNGLGDRADRVAGGSAALQPRSHRPLPMARSAQCRPTSSASTKASRRSDASSTPRTTRVRGLEFRTSASGDFIDREPPVRGNRLAGLGLPAPVLVQPPTVQRHPRKTDPAVPAVPIWRET